MHFMKSPPLEFKLIDSVHQRHNSGIDRKNSPSSYLIVVSEIF